MPEPLPPELTDYDISKLDGYRLERLRFVLPILKKSTTLITGEDRSLLIVCPSSVLKQTLARWVDIKMQAWFICSVQEVSLYSEEQVVIRSGATRPLLLVCSGSSPDGSNTLKDEISNRTRSMPTATPERTTTRQKSAKSTSKATETPATAGIPNLPTLKSLKLLSDRTGVSPEKIAAEIIALGGTAFFDEESSTYKALELSMDAWVEGWLDQDRAARKASLLGSLPVTPAEKNGRSTRAKAPPEPAATKTPAKTSRSAKSATPAKAPAPRRAKATSTPATNGKPRLNGFKISNSYPRTIDNFLTAQKWDDAKRIEVIESIVSGASDRDSVGSYYLERIVNKYPTHNRKAVREGILGKLKEMTGNTQTPSN